MSDRTRKIILVSIGVFIVFSLIRKTKDRPKNINHSDYLIVIDAGHGGVDPGTIGYTGVYEKDINLKIVNKLDLALKNKGYRLINIRDEDVYVDNILRTQIANEKDADFFISIHCNAMENKSETNGLQVLYYPSSAGGFSTLTNRDISDIMMEELRKSTRAKDKGVIPRENLIVLNKTRMPALIIESGFLSNEEEEKNLSSDRYQDKLVEGIVNGLDSILQHK